MNEFMNQYIVSKILDERFDGYYAKIKVEIPKDVFEEYFKEESYFVTYFPYGKIVFRKDMFFIKEHSYIFDDKVELEEI